MHSSLLRAKKTCIQPFLPPGLQVHARSWNSPTKSPEEPNSRDYPSERSFSGSPDNPCKLIWNIWA
jgi:hypothetical protein